MSVEIAEFLPEHLGAVIRFSRDSWHRPACDSFYRWRYLECGGFQRTVLALEGGECLALLSGLRKPYLFGRGRRECWEIFDWFCRPQRRGTGLGSAVVRAFMRGAEPAIGLGGTAASRQRLPRMGWRTTATVELFDLPLRGAVVARGLRRRLGLPTRLTGAALDPLVRAWSWPGGPGSSSGPRSAQRDVEVLPVPALGSEVASLYEGAAGYALAQIPDGRYIGWLGRGYGGDYVPFHAKEEGRLVGWMLLRLHPGRDGLEGALLDLYARPPEAAMVSALIDAGVRFLAANGAQRIRAAASCPILRRALRRRRFLSRGRMPVHLWSRESPPEGIRHFTLNHGDDAFLPYSPSPSEGAGLGVRSSGGLC